MTRVYGQGQVLIAGPGWADEVTGLTKGREYVAQLVFTSPDGSTVREVAVDNDRGHLRLFPASAFTIKQEGAPAP